MLAKFGSVPGAVANTGTTYYIAADGSDSADGLTTGTPMSVTKLLTLTLDNKTYLKFKKGDTFFLGDFIFSSHQGSIGAYGSGANPIIRGSEDISTLTWTSEGSGVYSTPMATAPKWIYIADVAARLAQTAWIATTAKPASNILRVNPASLSGYGDSLVGAELRVTDEAWWISYGYTVTAYDGGTGNITLDRDIDEAVAGDDILLLGQDQFISANNDWAYNSSEQKLYVKASASPSTLAIRSVTKDYAFELRARGITIDGVDLNQFYKCGYFGADGMTSEITIQNCVINNIKLRGILLINSNNSNINTNTVTYCGNNGIQVNGNGASCQSNTVHDIGMDANYQLPLEITNVTRSGGTGIGIRGNNNVTKYNVVYNTAWCGIISNGLTHETGYNHVYNYLKRFRDGSGIYSSGISLTSYNNAAWIHHNLVHDGQTAEIPSIVNGSGLDAKGIYLDNYSYSGLIEYNSTWNNPGSGFFVNTPNSGLIIRNNLAAQCSDEPFHIRGGSGTTTIQNTNNIFISTGSAGVCIEVTTGNPFTDSDTNNYINPYRNEIGLVNVTEYTLAAWRTLLSDDAASTAMVNYIAWSSTANAAFEVMVEDNYTDASVNFNIPAGYKQVDGTSGGTVSIPAYGGVAYLKETAYP